MLRPTMRRVASAVLASALLVGGLAVGSGTAAASIGDNNIYRTAENVTVTKYASHFADGVVNPWYVPAGDVETIHNRFTVAEGHERLLTRITDHGPAGFTYVPGSATIRIGYADNTSQSERITPEVGPGTVSVAAPGAGWSVPLGGYVIFSVEYRAPLTAPSGTMSGSGVTFDVAGHEGSLGWNPMGLNFIIGSRPVAPKPGSSELGFGS
ncbi:hypothetical protein [Rhodococcus sp. NPDC127528]|uniref:hypothetical protein n=1 Tax=unclassified Rhodococcus (in: high G+C Gram-positive bacteria) TaxID=192944 RepID=UPI00362EBE8E